MVKVESQIIEEVNEYGYLSELVISENETNKKLIGEKPQDGNDLGNIVISLVKNQYLEFEEKSGGWNNTTSSNIWC